MKSNYKSLLLLLAVFLWVLPFFSSVKAEEQVAEPISSSYSLTLPKSIDMGTATTKGFNYKVDGSIEEHEEVNVTVDKTYSLHRINDNATSVNGSASLSKTNFNMSDISSGIISTGNVSSNPTKAGSYTGNVIFNTSIKRREGYSRITYNANGGTLTEQEKYVPVGQPCGSLPTPTKSGYTFKGWYTQATGGNEITADTIMPSIDITIYAQWDINNYSMNYETNGGVFDVDKDAQLTIAHIKTEDQIFDQLYRYGFNKITAKNTSFYANTTFTVILSASTLKNKIATIQLNPLAEYVSFTINKVSDDTNNEIGSIDNGSHIIKFDKVETDYININITMQDRPVGNTDTLEFTAKTSETLYDYVTVNTVYDLPTPRKTGYTFGGWFNNPSFDGNKITKIENTTSDQTVYAKWIKDVYSITYNLNGGTISGQPTEYSIDTDTFTLPVPTRYGYTFIGWTGSNGGLIEETVEIAKGSTGERLYSAHWKENIGMSFSGATGSNYYFMDNHIIVTGAGGFSGQVFATLQYKVLTTGNTYELEFICNTDTSVVGIDNQSGMIGKLENKGNNRYVYTFTVDSTKGTFIFNPHITFNNIDATNDVTVNLYKLENN